MIKEMVLFFDYKPRFIKSLLQEYLYVILKRVFIPIYWRAFRSIPLFGILPVCFSDSNIHWVQRQKEI
jgi:hypothetical protein